MPQQLTYLPLRGAPRPLATFLQPCLGESFQSYVERLAAKHDVALAVILSRLGLVNADSKRPPSGYGIVLDDKHLELFCAVSRLPADTVRMMLLSAYDGIALDMAGLTSAEPDSIRKVAASQWAYFSGSHYCPGCLTESKGAWQLSWKLPWSFCCPRHQCLLNKFCPYCDQRACSGRGDGWLVPVFHGRTPRPGYCGNPLPRGLATRGQGGAPCGGPLGNAPAVDIAGFPASMAAQQRIHRMLCPVGVVDNKDVTASFFKELRSLSALLLYTAEVDDFEPLPEASRLAVQRHVDVRKHAKAERQELADGRKGPRPRSYRGTPEDPALMLAIVPHAFMIADSADDKELRRHLQPLADGLRARSSKYRWSALEYFQFSDRLRNAFTQCFETRGTFDRRIGHLSSKSASATQRYDFESCHVPQIMPAELFERSFSHLFPTLLENHARRFCSIALVKLQGGTWAEAVRELELPATSDRLPNHAVTELNRLGFYEQFSVELHKWATFLFEQSEKVDYGEARHLLADLVDIKLEDWQRVCEAAGMGVGRSGSRSRYCAAWLWADITGGDWRLAPALLSNSNQVTQREVYRAMQKTVFPQLAPHLWVLGRRLLIEGRLKQLAEDKGCETLQ